MTSQIKAHKTSKFNEDFQNKLHLTHQKTSENLNRQHVEYKLYRTQLGTTFSG